MNMSIRLVIGHYGADSRDHSIKKYFYSPFIIILNM